MIGVDLPADLRPHPAKYSPAILEQIETLLRDEAEERGRPFGRLRVLDPFAGTGLIHQLGCRSTGVELEPEWAAYDRRTIQGNALQLPWRRRTFDAVATSPCYGNRFADSYEAKDPSRRHGYRFSLDREPSGQSAAVLQWGEEYRAFHRAAWVEALRVLRRGGLFVLNVSDHQRDHRWCGVPEWHVAVLEELGCRLLSTRRVPTPRMQHGENREARAPEELVFALRAYGGSAAGATGVS